MTHLGRRLVPGNAKLLKELNQFQILDALRTHGSLARSELAKLTGLTPPTVGVLTAEMLAQGLLIEGEGKPSPTAGRRAVPLAIDPEAGVAVGINLSITRAQVLAVDLKGGIRGRTQLPVPRGATPEQVVAALSQAVHKMVASLRPRRVLGVGAGLHGLVDHETGTMRFAPHFGWRDVPFAAMLSEALGWPVVADNDVRCIALGELWFGAGRGLRNFVCVRVGTGIGSGIVMDGQVYRGIGSMAGEIGHLTVDLRGPRCHCGSRGCLETVASGPGIAARAAALLSREEERGRNLAEGKVASELGERSLLAERFPDVTALTAQDVAAAAQEGDQLSRSVLAEAGTYLGVTLANLVKTLNPEVVLVGGGVTGAAEPLWEPMRQAMAEQAMDQATAAVRVLPVALGVDAAPVGAATLVLDRFFRGGALPALLQWLDR